MNRSRSKLLILVLTLQLQLSSCAEFTFAEPSYCDPRQFKKLEVTLKNSAEGKENGLVNAHAFQLGQTTLIGVAVGDSDTQALVQLSKRFGADVEQKRYCTWYLNHPKFTIPYDSTHAIQASKIFIRKDIVKSPSVIKKDEAIQQFIDVMGSSFEGDSITFVSCALEQHYIALGCNGMMHRGPTVFGMLLAFSGCSPEHSLTIVNDLWGLNGLQKTRRLGAIQWAYTFGQAHLDSRNKLAEAWTQKQRK